MDETLLDERYLLIEAIGSGGEARVFRALDTVMGTMVAARLALKPVTYLAPDSVPTHAHWVQFFHWGVDAQLGAYQIFELLEGRTLDAVMQSGPMETNAWRLFVEQSLDAVAELHLTGWVHGDLNAGNFFHSSTGWKLLELPFLRFDPPANRSALFGSIHTLAPEQIDGAPADVRSDLYSLGCLYYYAACGEFPHTGVTSQDIAIQRLRFAPVPLAEKAPHLPPAWSAWVMPLLARDPYDRYPSALAARQMLGVA
jgi:serine/threonine protein kinase